LHCFYLSKDKQFLECEGNTGGKLGIRSTKDQGKLIKIPIRATFTFKNMKIAKITLGLSHTLVLLEDHKLVLCAG